MPRTQFLIASIVLALVGSACSFDDGDDTPKQAQTPAQTHPPDQQTSSECINDDIQTAPVNSGSAAGDLVALSGELFSCAPTAVVVGDPAATTSAAELATALRAPILLPHDDLETELTRLDPSTVYMVSADSTPAATGAATAEATTASETSREAEPNPAPGPTLDYPDGGATAEAQSIVQHISPDEAGRLATQFDPDAGDTTFIDPASDPAQIISNGVPHDGDASAVWLADVSDAAALAPVQAMAATAGAAVVPVDGSDLLAHPEPGEAIRAHEDAPIRLIGEIPAEADWELNLLASGHRLPGGGYLMFDGETPLRFIAYYGHPDSAGMGALGQQNGPEATYEAMRPLLDKYDTGDAIVVPTFNPIATVAHNGGSTDRPDNVFESGGPRYVEFSTMHPPSRFTEYVEYAEQIDGYVTLDFQPGRNDFLYQVKHYEELLKRPNVGIALDPEWRLGPNEEHLQQIGSVPAAELNEVINYVADLVRDEGLPQKLILLHQFRTSMITERDTLVDREEIALVIQMDGEGQGGLSVKDDTWHAITAGAEDAHWHWGWKNFFERDNPGPNSPKDTLSKDPQPVYISYQ